MVTLSRKSGVSEFIRAFVVIAGALAVTMFFSRCVTSMLAGFSWEELNVVAVLKRARVPVLLFHGEQDRPLALAWFDEKLTASASD